MSAANPRGAWSHRSLSPGPVLRLFAAPRTALALVAAGSWTFGVLALGAFAEMQSARALPTPELAQHLQGSIAAYLAIAIPAFLGLLLVESGGEVLRRPMLARLPSVDARLARASLLLGTLGVLGTLVIVQGYAPPLEHRFARAPGPGPHLGVFTHSLLAWLPMATLGLAVGAWLFARVGRGWAWVWRLIGLAALGYFAADLLLLFWRFPALGAFVALLAGAAFRWRLSAPLARSLAQTRRQSLFGTLSSWSRDAERERLRGPLDDSLPPERSGGNLTGWLALTRYQQCTQGIGTHVRRGEALAASFAVLLVAFGPLLLTLAGRVFLGLEREVAPWSRAVEVLLGGGESATFGLHWIVLLLAWIQALGALEPLPGRLLYPLSRRDRAALAAAFARRSGLVIFLFLALAGLALGFLALAFSDGPRPGGVPLALGLALLGPAAFVLFHTAAHSSRRLAGAGHPLAAASLWILAGAIGLTLGLTFHHGTLDPTQAATAVAFACVSALALVLQPAFLRGHFARASLP